ncbi:hypothetical protein [Micrococcus lylae]|uniref:hypothetical protein n=1 Tax=Micrococcus lylae TaxID=1273 RepID=UPI0011AF3642|nr:hypothetical protein [Micrococcus lylae]WIK81779.1 hypothetical protein CJ228_009240 [Micrococcus lylae]
MAKRRDQSVALICVHGIGGRAEHHAHLAKGALRALEGIDPQKLSRFSVKKIEGCTVPKHADIGGVGSIEFIDRGGSRTDVTVFDASWYQTRIPKSTRSILLWILKIAPFLPLFLAAGWITDRSADPPKSSEEQSSEGGIRGGRAWITTLPREELRGFLGASFLFILFSLLEILMILLSPFIALACLFSVRIRRRVNSALTTVLGDALLYQNEELEAGMGEVQEACRRLSGSFDRIVLLGHSQGGDIVRRIAGSTKVKIDSVVTVGSGRSPLTLLRWLNSHRLVRVLYFALVFVLFPFFAGPVIWFLVVDILVLILWFASVILWLIATLIEILAVGNLSAQKLQMMDGILALGLLISTWNIIPITVNIVLFFVVALALALVIRYFARNFDPGTHLESARLTNIANILDPVSIGSSFGEAGTLYTTLLEDRRGFFVSLIRCHTTYFDRRGVGEVLAKVLVQTDADTDPLRKHPPSLPKWTFLLGGVSVLLMGACTVAVSSILHAILALALSLVQ